MGPAVPFVKEGRHAGAVTRCPANSIAFPIVIVPEAESATHAAPALPAAPQEVSNQQEPYPSQQEEYKNAAETKTEWVRVVPIWHAAQRRAITRLNALHAQRTLRDPLRNAGVVYQRPYTTRHHQEQEHHN
jgi:hypothetical protein